MRSLLLLAFISQLLFFNLSVCEAQTQPPALQAEGAVLMDSRTGEVLWQKNSEKSLAPASTTKIMTAILAIESGKLKQSTVISEAAANTEGSSLHLKAGQTYTLEDLLTGLLMRSGNDCAVAIAEAVAGSTDSFVTRMNSKAAIIGALDTAFKNPHGLPAEGHRSTAYDLAWIARYALRLPEFSAIVNTRQTSIDNGKALENTNKLLWLLPEADGVKTGTTSEAGPCLVASATKNGHQLIAVTLNDKQRWQDAEALLTWGFNNFTLYEYTAPDTTIETLPVKLGVSDSVPVIAKETAIVIAKADRNKLSVKIDLPDKINAPVYQGQKVGSLNFMLADKLVKSVDLEAGNSVAERSISRFLIDQLSLLFRFFAQLGII